MERHTTPDKHIFTGDYRSPNDEITYFHDKRQ